MSTSSHRLRGSVLLFVIGIVAVMIALCFGFLRAVVLQRTSGQAGAMRLLAMQAAQMGAQHAFEQILRDHVSQPITTFDNASRSVFRAHYLPLTIGRDGDPSDTRLADYQDTSSENLLHEPLWWDNYGNNIYLGDGYCNNGGMTSGYRDGGYGGAAQQGTDGRGRWIEPNCYGSGTALPLSSAGAVQQLPNLPVRFGDGDAVDVDGAGWGDGVLNAVGVALQRPPAATPDATVDVLTPLLDPATGSRCAPLLLDVNLRRIPCSSRADYLAARQTARYRLRYACEVRDLDGLLLINPDLDLDYRAITSADPRAYAASPDPLLAGVVAFAHAVPNVLAPILALNNNTGPVAPRLQHLFMGRGSTANYDRVSDADYWPRTFPLMYRSIRSTYMTFQNNPLISWTNRQWPTESDARNIWGPGAPGSAAGGVAIAGVANSWAWRHDQTGPQFSFYNSAAAVPGVDSQSPPEVDEDSGDGSWTALRWISTPFGRGVSGNGQGGRYGGAVRTPWHLNLLTCHPLILRGMLYATIPANAMQCFYQARTSNWPYGVGSAEPGCISYWGPMRNTADVRNYTHSAAFAYYPPPASTYVPLPATTAVPDYRSFSAFPGDPAYRFPQDIYPGPLVFNGVPPAAALPSAWSASTAYALGNTVYYGPNVYVCSKAGTSSAITGPTGTGSNISNGSVEWDYASSVSGAGIAVSDGVGAKMNDDIVNAASQSYWKTQNPTFAADPYTGFRIGVIDSFNNSQLKTIGPGGRAANPPPLPTAPPPAGYVYTNSDQWGRWYNNYSWANVQCQSDSIWYAIAYAFNQAWAVARHGHARFETAYYTPKSTDVFKTSSQCTPLNMRQFDRLFLECLGHDPDNPASDPPSAAAKQGWSSNNSNYQPQLPFTWTRAGNLFTSAQPTTAEGAKTAAALPTRAIDIYDPAAIQTWLASSRGMLPAPVTWTASSTHLTQAAELAINDFRFSLFGSSPEYTKDFRPLDLNGDGFVAFSGYASGRYAIAPAFVAADKPATQTTAGLSEDAMRHLFKIDQDCAATTAPFWPVGAGEWATDSDGDGQISPSEFAAAGITPFCVAGNFFIGRSRFWAVTVRGELWDNQLRQQAAQSTLETVLALDQAGQADGFLPDPLRPGIFPAGNASLQYSSQVLFQRWHFNLYQGLQARNY